LQPEAGGKLHLKLNTAASPIEHKYREGQVKRTLKREFKVRETVQRQTGGRSNRGRQSSCRRADWRESVMARVNVVTCLRLYLPASYRRGGCLGGTLAPLVGSSPLLGCSQCWHKSWLCLVARDDRLYLWALCHLAQCLVWLTDRWLVLFTGKVQLCGASCWRLLACLARPYGGVDSEAST